MMEYTRFEKVRIIGARALQISLGAPILVKDAEGEMDPVKIAIKEMDQGLIPITVIRPKA
ncbi:MAG: DNA-directed RNA polymerase subunit K [Candidatus Aenigmarchaeota archaeon]|nr:DNA-directed RNA polymerase subunit K [Candidatus Aenigmarchaeota archaeon]